MPNEPKFEPRLLAELSQARALGVYEQLPPHDVIVETEPGKLFSGIKKAEEVEGVQNIEPISKRRFKCIAPVGSLTALSLIPEVTYVAVDRPRELI